MRVVVQRVSQAHVEAANSIVGRIEGGLLAYVGVERGDSPADVEFIAGKLRHLRVFADSDGKLNRDVTQVGGAILVVSNFTLLADTRKGRRPAFTEAADPAMAEELYDGLCARLRDMGLAVETGRFRESMAVHAVNEGPINLLLDSKGLA